MRLSSLLLLSAAGCTAESPISRELVRTQVAPQHLEEVGYTHASPPGEIVPVSSDSVLHPYDATKEAYEFREPVGEGNGYGYALAGAGDIDGDGYEDFVVSSQIGAYVYYGALYGLSARVDVVASPFITAVAGAGDVNGDGYADVLFGGPEATIEGEAFVMHGTASGLDISVEHELFPTIGADHVDRFGDKVAGVGDLNADGYDDVAISAPYEDVDGVLYSGAVYVYFGSASGAEQSSELKARLIDLGSADYYGYSLSGAGDVDGDGYDDLVIGTLFGAPDAYVHYGHPDGLDPTRHDAITTNGAGWTDTLDVAGGQDVNGDGFDDIAVAGNNKNLLFVYLGGAGGVDTESPVVLPTPNGDLATRVDLAPDVDGDGYADLIIGTNPYPDYKGAAFVFFGGEEPFSTRAPDDFRTGENWDDFGFAVGHVDYNGDGLGDILIGAYGDDQMDHNSGAVFLYEGGYAWTDHDEDGVLDGDDLCLGDDALGDSDADGNCDLDLSITDRQVGSFIELGAVGAPPGASVLFVASPDLGSDCHGSLDVCTGLDGPRVVGRSTVGLDHTGELTLDTSALVGVWHVQAVWVLDGQAEASNVLVDVCLGDADGDGVEDCMDTCVGQDLAGDVDADGRCEPVLTLPAIMSGDVTLSLFGAPVGADVNFYGSDTLGSDCSLGIDTCLDLDAPELLGTAVANGAGAAEIDFLVEDAGTMYFQATWSFGPDAEASDVETRTLTP